MNELLKGLSVWESATSPAVRYCGRLMAMAGAMVQCESNTHACGTTNALDDYLNHLKVPWGKSSQDSHQNDVVLADPGFEWGSLAPGVISGTVDPFHFDASKKAWRSSELVLASIGGAANYTRTDHGVPVYGFGRRFQYLAGTYLYTAIVSLLGSAKPEQVHHPRVRVANDEVVISLLPYGTTQYGYNGTTTTVEQSGPRFVTQCTDGFLCVYAGGSWSRLAKMLGEIVDPDDRRFTNFGSRFAHVNELEPLIQKWCNGRTLQEAITAAEAASVAVAPCYRLDDALSDANLFDNQALSWQMVRNKSVAMAQIAYNVKESNS